MLAGTGRNSFLSRVEAAGVTAGPHLLQQENTASLWEADWPRPPGDVFAFPQHWARFRCPAASGEKSKNNRATQPIRESGRDSD